MRRDEGNKAPPCLGQDDLPECPFLFVAQSQGGFALAGVHRFKRIPDDAESPRREDQGKTDHSHNNGGERCLPEYNVVEDHEDDDRRNTGNQTAVDRDQTVEHRIVPVPQKDQGKGQKEAENAGKCRDHYGRPQSGQDHFVAGIFDKCSVKTPF